MPAPIPDDGSSLTHAGLSLVTHRDGSIVRTDGSGLYAGDRRIIRGLRLLLDDVPAAVLSASRVGPWSDRLVYGVWRGGSAPAALIVRDRSLASGFAETFTITTFADAIDLDLTISIEPGAALVSELDDEPDDQTDPGAFHDALSTTVFAVDGTELRATVSLAAHEERRVGWRLALDGAEPRLPETPEIDASDPTLERVVQRAGWDLKALTMLDPKTSRPFTAAGAPHFLAVFGRDALLASLLSMSNGVDRALDTLDVLAAYQGVETNDHTLEEPGRIPHEVRVGEMGTFGLEPGTPYFGAIDPTPLFVVVLRECLAWGASPARLRPLLPAARAAIDWCRRHVDHLGFVQSVPDPNGFANQNWRNSSDAVVRPDGSVVDGPSTPAEVQGYVHAALVGLAELEEALGDPTLAVDLRAEADDLKERFAQAFVTRRSTAVSFSLDDAGSPLDVCASNVGHLLSTQIIDAKTARRLADRLLGPAEFSGWGVRTMSANEAAYNPLGYHLGSVWPHDNAMILRGLSQQGFKAEARRLIDALIALANVLDGQLPELLGGFDRVEFGEPVAYPASARPQAWAAAVPFQIVTSLLGMTPVLHRSELRFDPLLHDDEQLQVRGIRLGGRMLDIEATGQRVTVTGDVRGITIVTPAYRG